MLPQLLKERLFSTKITPFLFCFFFCRQNNEIQTAWGFGGPKNLPNFERIIVVTFVMVTKKYYAIKQL